MNFRFNTAIIDMDVLVYRCGFSIEKYNRETETLEVEPMHHAFYNINSMMQKIIQRTQCQQYYGYLTSSDKSNFRFQLFEDYKANRKDARKPVFYNEIRDFLIKKWDAIVISDQEADDECSIRHCEYNSLGWDPDIKNSVVCSFDKDFNNIPGWHYNYVKDDIYYVSELNALKSFYLQILTGDNSDGIPRIKKGWFEKKSRELIKESRTEEELYDIVFKEIKKVTELSDEETEDLLINRGRLVWLRREPEELWLPPKHRLTD